MAAGLLEMVAAAAAGAIASATAAAATAAAATTAAVALTATEIATISLTAVSVAATAGMGIWQGVAGDQANEEAVEATEKSQKEAEKKAAEDAKMAIQQGASQLAGTAIENKLKQRKTSSYKINSKSSAIAAVGMKSKSYGRPTIITNNAKVMA